MENKSFIKGIIGGIIGGFVATIPWVLMYVYGNMILSALAIIIAMGVLKGYQLCKGKVNKSLPVVVMVISLLCVSISTLLIIPMLLCQKELGYSNFEVLKLLYSSSEFVKALFSDFIWSVLFTIIGAGVVVKNIKTQLDAGVTENIKATLPNDYPEREAAVKELFIKARATDKSRAIEKTKLMADLKEMNALDVFNQLKFQSVIKKGNNGYYYCESNDTKAKKILIPILKGAAIAFIAILAVVLLILVLS